MSREAKQEDKRGIRCPQCGCRHLYVLYTRHRANTVIRARTFRHHLRRIVTHERIIDTEHTETGLRGL
jgi:DNA-directed RNA polymerase subunit RPC12/RpoP